MRLAPVLIAWQHDPPTAMEGGRTLPVNVVDASAE